MESSGRWKMKVDSWGQRWGWIGGGVQKVSDERVEYKQKEEEGARGGGCWKYRWNGLVQ